MREHGMIFQGWSVRAIINGRKRQTRRLLNPQPTVPDQHITFCLWGNELAAADKRDMEDGVVDEWRVIGKGDRIWVRETWRPILSGMKAGGTDYRADDPSASGEGFIPWRPSIHLRRADARLVLDVADVRVQRLWDITEADAIAEGVECIDNPDFDPEDPCDDPEQCYRAGFADQWVKINGQESWDANRWVVAYTFEPVPEAKTVKRKAVGT